MCVWNVWDDAGQGRHSFTKLSAILNTACSLVSENVSVDLPDHDSWNEVGGAVGGAWEEVEGEGAPLRWNISNRLWQNDSCGRD